MYSRSVSLHKIVCAVSLTTFFTVVVGLMVGSEVRADGSDESGVGADAETLERASDFAGEYRFVGGQKEAEGIQAAIDESVDALNPMLRKIGRKRLVESNPVPKSARIELDGGDIVLSIDGEGYEARLDGSPRKMTSKYGDKIKVSYKLSGDRLVEHIDSPKGDRFNYATLSADGNKLTVRVKVSSSHLPVPCEYRLTFRRK